MKWLTFVITSLLIGISSICMAQSISGPTALQLTVYNGNFALVKDTRAVTLNAGINSIEVSDVAEKIDPTSILFKSLSAPNSVSILEQNYQFDLMTPENILAKSVGQKITITSYDGAGKPHVTTGTVMNSPTPVGNNYMGSDMITYTSTPAYNTVIQTDDGHTLLYTDGQVTLDKMPAGLHPKPTLNWLLKSKTAGEQQAQISYITDGINWQADYVALVSKDDKSLDLTGWVTLTNDSGARYENARLTLMAGDVKRQQPAYKRNTMAYMVDVAGAPEAPQFEEKSFFEYHMYSMERPTTIQARETKQLSLLSASSVPLKKELIYDGRGNWWRSWWYPGRTDFAPGSGYDTSDNHKVNIVLEAVNSKENSMGFPLPKGRVRVYKLDDQGSQQFIGEDSIDHTPRDEKIRLNVGDAFDVVGDYKRTNYSKISDKVIEETFEVSLRNHKDTAETVDVIDHVWSDWQVTKSSAGFNKKDAHTIVFPVSVPANGETKVTYTIRTKW